MWHKCVFTELLEFIVKEVFLQICYSCNPHDDLCRVWHWNSISFTC